MEEADHAKGRDRLRNGPRLARGERCRGRGGDRGPGLPQEAASTIRRGRGDITGRTVAPSARKPTRARRHALRKGGIRSGGKPRRRQRRTGAAGFGPEVELGPGESHDITTAGCGDVDVSLESALFQDEALGGGRGVVVAAILGLLFLPFLDRFAHGTGVLAVEGFLRAFDQAVLRGVVDDHVRPGDDLHHAPVAAAEMQAAQDGDEDAHESVQGVGGLR